MNDQDNLFDEFMKLGDTSEIDNRILSEAGDENLIERVHDQKEKAAEARSPMARDFRRNWFIYTLMILSFILTEMLALYIGLSPEKRSNPDGSTYLFFHTDIPHLLTALVYMLVFPIVTEIAFVVAWEKFKRAETGNKVQSGVSIAAIIASALSVIGTGVAGGYVIYSTLGSIGFVEVPPEARGYLIWMIPILIALLGTLNQIYEASSKHAKEEKLEEERARTDELNDRLRMSQIERSALRAIRVRAINSYMGAITRGLLSEQEARAGLAAGKSLIQLEKELKRDLTGDGKIGDPSASPRPAPTTRRIFPPPPHQNKEYTLDELLAFAGVTKEQALGMIRQYNLNDARKAYEALSDNNYLPGDLTFENFNSLYIEIVSSSIVARDPGPQAPARANGSGNSFT